MDFSINTIDNGDFAVTETQFNHRITPRTFMTTSANASANATKKDFKTKSCDFILLSPLQPSIFGYQDHEVSRMIAELQDVGIQVMLVDTGPEMIFYARAHNKTLLESLCTSYDIGGILVEAAAVYDQVEIKEVV